MSPQSPSFDPKDRRAGVRRTAWIIGAIVLLIYIGGYIQRMVAA
ncbi:hypothetical protein [Tahibacter amnicola]|uniref:Uncharacterized protein n=1 Tax=Tahibacter amnicola TaxID=2976241 RepID=A0ABY6BF37_9GAMM|nr:hypothetical protein [Tahibacter amnicola]UXI68648.1 hypothetical protein N4264_03075 [Tahibacter amnicola]